MNRKLILFFLIFTLCLGFVSADTYLKKVTHSQAMGQTKDTISEIWFTANSVATKNGDVRVIFKGNENKLYFVNDKTHKYAVFSLPIQLPPQMEQMMKMFNLKFNLKKTGETAKINNWNCEKFIVTSTQDNNAPMKISMNMEIYATKDIKVNTNLFEKFNQVMAFSNPMVKNMVEEMKKLNGAYPVKTTITMGMMGKNTKTASEIKEVKYGSAPASFFGVPSGYQKMEGNFMQVMQNLNK